MKIRPTALVLAAAAVLGTWAWAAAEPAPGRANTVRPPRGPATPARGERDEQTQVRSIARRIDGNSINMFVTNYGSIARDIQNQGNSGLFFPKGTNKTAVYASGLWIGGKDRTTGEIRAAAGEYATEYQPGRIVSPGVADDPALSAYTVYKVNRYTGQATDTSHVERSAVLTGADRTLDPLAHHSWSEYVNQAGPTGAPLRKYYQAGAPGDSIWGPDMLGDQMTWAVYNDEFTSPREVLNSAPMGVEVKQRIFAFDRQGALGNTVFLDYWVYNRGTSTYDSCYVVLWSDPDLGGAGDDLVGCDTTLSVGYIYNATNTDQLYGDRPPAVGYDFFKGPSTTSGTLGLTSFIFYINGTDPSNATQGFNYMRGFLRDGDPIINPQNSQETKFQFPGDPVRGTGWLDSNPGDRRFMCISGPFTLAAGDSQRIVGAIVIAQGGDRLSSVTGMKFFDIKAQKAFDIDFDLPPAPPQPRVTFSTDHGLANLLWDSGSRFNYSPAPGYAFEGYNVYQGSSVSGPWKRLATFDEVNGIADVRDTVFDVNTGLIVNDTPTAFGGDNGVQYSYSVAEDKIKGGPLRDGTTYFYAVTAYAVNPNPPRGLEKVLETSFQPVSVVVQRPASGTDVASSTVSESVARPGGSTNLDRVEVDIVDPASITGHTYAVTYNGGPTQSPNGVTAATWNLVDLTDGRTLLANQTEKTTSPSYASTDGFLLKLIGGDAAAADGIHEVFYTPFRTSPTFIGLDGAGLHNFGDGFGYANDFFYGIDYTATPEAFPNVELRFGSTQKAYVYFRDELDTGGAPPGGRGYTYGGFVDVPFQAWDVDHNVQLEVGFVERRAVNASSVETGPQPATHDRTWMPDGSGNGGREYLFIHSLPYTGTASATLARDSDFDEGGTPILGGSDQWYYAAWLVRPGGRPVVGDKFHVRSGTNPGAAGDTLVFTTTGPRRNDVALQQSRLDRIRVVPNPYYSRSSYELTTFDKVIKFMNMPETATVKIYDLAGHLVRTLRKTDPAGSILQWNLENENRLPVASGVYIYTVEVPGAGTHTGRLAVFIEKERLQNF